MNGFRFALAAIAALVAAPALALHAENESPGGIVLPGLLLILYMAPSLIALRRASPGLARVIVVNLLLGWTVIGWLAALLWALGENEAENGRSA